jgi:hypothetical protein
MLRSDRFYAYLAGGGAAQLLDLADAVERLVALRRNGDERLTANREKRRLALEAKAETFDPTLPIDQGLALLSAPVTEA